MEKKQNKSRNNKNEISQPHDITFKKLFGKTEIAKDVIEKNLPKEVLDVLDMDSLEKLDGSFISEKLKETFSDIIYGVKIHNKDAYIALLLEHKSYKDKLAIFQVARYIIDIWSKITEESKREIPIVIPIVVYHGKGKWDYKKDIRELIPDYHILPKYLKERLPVLKHDFVNITGHNEKDIKEYNPITRLVIRSLKYIFEDDDKLIEQFLISIEEIPAEVTDEELVNIVDILLIYYSAVNKNLTEEDIARKIQELGGKGEKIMTILQEREQRGIEQGIELGMEQGIEKGMELGELKKAKQTAKDMILDGEPIDKIIRYTRLDVEEIEKLKREMLKS